MAATRTLRPEGAPETLDPDFAIRPVASLQEVLGALGDAVRLEMVRRLVAAGGPLACTALYDGVGKSTASHHFKTLREAGLLERHVIGGAVHQALRREAIESAYPGLLTAVVAAADREADRG